MQLFELFVGQPPFDPFLLTPPILIKQMCEAAREDLPKRWQEALDKDERRECLEVYFGGPHNPDLTRDATSGLGLIAGKLLYLEPSARAAVGQILEDPSFQEQTV
ncbi:hypothetical protein N7470_006135 [Penicillium chermesinum]|nr:hypothetical protein N7470_006135 [Penicillium chermesinum]